LGCAIDIGIFADVIIFKFFTVDKSLVVHAYEEFSYGAGMEVCATYDVGAAGTISAEEKEIYFGLYF
jgi:hypothetical protein